MRAKKSLGQNFLTSKGVVGDIMTAAELSAKDTVLEIGPGKGFLTEELLKKAGKVIAIEKDDRLIDLLKEKFSEEIKAGKLTLVHGDILNLVNGEDSISIISRYKLDTSEYKVVANIPYYITGQILRLFLESDAQPEKMVLMVQKEVAKRIVAHDEKESILSISIKVYGTPKLIKKVPARYFSPKPKVDSAILLIKDISKKLFKNKKEEEFFKLVTSGFSQKRKKLVNNLSTNYKNYKKGKIEELFDICDIKLNTRAEKLSVNKWMCLNDKGSFS